MGTDKTSLKADREVLGGEGAHLESLRFHFNLTLASLKTLANHSENEAGGTNHTGGSAAPREPAKPKRPSENKGQPLYTPQNPCRKHQGSSIISQNNFFDFAKQSRAPNPKGTGRATHPED